MISKLYFILLNDEANGNLKRLQSSLTLVDSFFFFRNFTIDNDYKPWEIVFFALEVMRARFLKEKHRDDRYPTKSQSSILGQFLVHGMMSAEIMS